MGLYLAAGGAVAAQWLAGLLDESAVAAATAAVLVVGLGARWFGGASASGGPIRRERIGWGPIAVAVAVAGLAADLTARTMRPPTDASHIVRLLEGHRSGERFELEACVRGPVRRSPMGLRMVAEVRALRSPQRRLLRGRLLVFVRHPRRAWEPGACFSSSSKLRPISNFGNPGEFDWAGWNARRGVFVSTFVWDDDELERLPAAPGRAGSVRAALVRAIERVRGDGQARALVTALVAGDRTRLDRPTVESMRAAGLSHVLAISGLHMGLVGGVVLWMVGRGALYTRAVRAGVDQQRLAAPAAACALAAYALVSGGGVSVGRSLLMAAVVLSALWRGVRGSGARALAWAALALALLRPGAALDASYQLSFVAVAALLVRAAGAARSPGPAHGRLRSSATAVRLARELMVVAMLAWAATTPLVAQHFQRISVPAPLVNVVAAAPVGATVLAGLAGAALLLVSPDASAVALWLACRCARLVLVVAERGARLPGAGLAVPAPGWPLAVVLVGLPFGVCLGRTVRWRVVGTLTVAAAVLLAHAAYERYRTDRMEVVFAAVGQGDATIVRLPGGEVIVVDAGRPGRGRIVVAPLLRRMHVGRIDYLVVSHVQSDHWGGVAELAASFELGELWHPGGACDVEGFGELVTSLQADGVEIVDVGATHAREGRGPRRGGGAGWRLEAPWPRDVIGDCDANDRSIVLALRFAGHTVLLPGDIEADAEAALAVGADVRADLLKVPHHGSLTSSTVRFLDAVRPRLAVASVGAGNRYGLPHGEVEDRYRKRGVQLLRTDHAGAVTAVIDASGVRVRTAKDR